jgi:hypothetical protein
MIGAIPPENTCSVPPLDCVVKLANPKAETRNSPLVTVALFRMPPLETMALALSTMTLRRSAPLRATSVTPSLTVSPACVPPA